MPEGIALVYFGDLLGYSVEAMYPDQFKIHEREVMACYNLWNIKNARNCVIEPVYSGSKYCIFVANKDVCNQMLIWVLYSSDEYQKFDSYLRERVQKFKFPIAIQNVTHILENLYHNR